MLEIDNLKFDESGLIPAIVQDCNTKKVLMVAYMNRESLEISLKEKSTCFYSRSRQQLWRKGESSGNTQEIISITADCDEDALLVEVIPAGPACHTGETSCFYQNIYRDDEKSAFSLDGLYEFLEKREQERPKDSYTTYLFNEGVDKILKKVGEESTEVVIAAKNNSREEMVYETSDLVYHMLVLMVNQGISISEIKTELAKRHGGQ